MVYPFYPFSNSSLLEFIFPGYGKVIFGFDCQNQNWSLPNPIIYYIAKNPSTSKVYQKLIQSCKYFFEKNPILVLEDLIYFDTKNQWSTFHGTKLIDIKNTSKFWITEFISTNFSDNENIISSIIPKIYKCDAKILCLENQIFSYNDFAFLASNVEKIDFKEVSVMDENGSIVPFEKFFEALPKIEKFDYKCDTNLSNITPKTVKELLKLPNFLQIKTFPYEIRLEEIIDEFIEAENQDYKIPMISFFGLDGEKYCNLREAFWNCC
uniref:DUF38 domain-containing protein n=1 Tax=Panagrolaimus sp. PS1159 TaxID=55785 RepID=A0AC35GW88_9BILA